MIVSYYAMLFYQYCISPSEYLAAVSNVLFNGVDALFGSQLGVYGKHSSSVDPPRPLRG